MDKYKDYVARTQADRIALDTLVTLEGILQYLRMLSIPASVPFVFTTSDVTDATPTIVSTTDASSTTTEIEKQPVKRGRKPKGDN